MILEAVHVTCPEPHRASRSSRTGRQATTPEPWPGARFGQDEVVEPLTVDDWRPASFLVVAQLDTTVRDLEYRSFLVELDEVHGEHAAVVRLAGSIFCLVAASGTSLGGLGVSNKRRIC